MVFTIFIYERIQRLEGGEKIVKPRILIINGSPRKYGAITKLLAIAEKGVRDAGGEPEKIFLYDHEIKECLGCVSDNGKYCRFPCLIKDDDFNAIAQKILESDGFIIGTPLYWYTVSGRLKNFIDRLTSLENMIFITGRSLLEGKIAGFIVSGNDSGSIMAIAYLMVTFNSMGVHIPGWALAYHHSADDVLEDRQAVMDSYNVGYIVTKAAEMLRERKEWYQVYNNLDELVKIGKQEAEKYIEQKWQRTNLFEQELKKQ